MGNYKDTKEDHEEDQNGSKNIIEKKGEGKSKVGVNTRVGTYTKTCQRRNKRNHKYHLYN